MRLAVAALIALFAWAPAASAAKPGTCRRVTAVHNKRKKKSRHVRARRAAAHHRGARARYVLADVFPLTAQVVS